MASKKEFLDILCNPGRVTPITKEQAEVYNRIIPLFQSFYAELDLTKRLEWAISASSYLFGKAMEIAVLSNIRPEEKSVWMVPYEVLEGITFNLPKHLENEIIDYMDTYEQAVEEYIKSNIDADPIKIWIFSEHIGFYQANKDKPWEKTVGGISNDKVLTNNELYRFGMNAFKREIENDGFICKSIAGNLVDFANAIVSKGANNYLVATSVTILPREGYIEEYRLTKLKEEAERVGAIPAISYIGLIPVDELYAAQGIAIREGDYKVSVKKLQNVNTGTFVE